MKQVVVLGIGNRLLRDDGIGIYVVEKLREQDTTDTIRYVIGETDIDYCLDEIKEAEFIVVVDADKTGESPGNVTVIPLDKVISAATPGLSCHNLHLFDMIVYFNKELNGILVGIAVFEISYGIGLSQILNDQFADIFSKVQSIIRSLNSRFLKRELSGTKRLDNTF
jgi:hydrogenase maturation protease